MNSTRRPLVAIAAAVGLLLVQVVVRPGAAVASSGASRAVEILAPANAGRNANAVAVAVSCASLSSCAVSGGYLDTAGDGQPLVATQARGRWGRAREVVLPPDAEAAHQNAAAFGVGCTGPGTCVAVGDYGTTAGEDAFIAPEVAGTWRQAFAPQLPANAVQNAGLQGVSCHGVGSCTAVGTYETNTVPDQIEGLAVTEVHGRWQRGVEITPPAGAARPNWLELLSVFCASAGSCAAVGVYTDRAQHGQTAAVTETSGRWGRAVRISAPPNAAPEQSNPTFNGITCTAPGWCVAVGTYQDRSGHAEAMIATEISHRWQRATEIRPPAGAAANPFAHLNSIACPQTGRCIAVGSYTSKAGPAPAMLVTESRGRWSRAVASTALPPNHATGANEYSEPYSVACPSRRYCVAVGGYQDKAQRIRTMALTLLAP
jgi:hypothetical protein